MNNINTFGEIPDIKKIYDLICRFILAELKFRIKLTSQDAEEIFRDKLRNYLIPSDFKSFDLINLSKTLEDLESDINLGKHLLDEIKGDIKKLNEGKASLTKDCEKKYSEIHNQKVEEVKLNHRIRDLNNEIQEKEKKCSELDEQINILLAKLGFIKPNDDSTSGINTKQFKEEVDKIKELKEIIKNLVKFDFIRSTSKGELEEFFFSNNIPVKVTDKKGVTEVVMDYYPHYAIVINASREKSKKLNESREAAKRNQYANWIRNILNFFNPIKETSIEYFFEDSIDIIDRTSGNRPEKIKQLNSIVDKFSSIFI